MGRIGLAITVVCAVLVALLSAKVRAQEDEGVHWETDLSAARLAAAEKGRPLIVVFR